MEMIIRARQHGFNIGEVKTTAELYILLLLCKIVVDYMKLISCLFDWKEICIVSHQIIHCTIDLYISKLLFKASFFVAGPHLLCGQSLWRIKVRRTGNHTVFKRTAVFIRHNVIQNSFWFIFCCLINLIIYINWLVCDMFTYQYISTT